MSCTDCASWTSTTSESTKLLTSHQHTAPRPDLVPLTRS